MFEERAFCSFPHSLLFSANCIYEQLKNSERETMLWRTFRTVSSSALYSRPGWYLYSTRGVWHAVQSVGRPSYSDRIWNKPTVEHSSQRVGPAIGPLSVCVRHALFDIADRTCVCHISRPLPNLIKSTYLVLYSLVVVLVVLKHSLVRPESARRSTRISKEYKRATSSAKCRGQKAPEAI